MKVLRLKRMDMMRNDYSRGTAQVEQLGDKGRDPRLRWVGHAHWRNGGPKDVKNGQEQVHGCSEGERA